MTRFTSACLRQRACAQHVHLDQMHGVDVGLRSLMEWREPGWSGAAPSGAARLTGAHTAMELGLEHIEDALAELRVFYQSGVERAVPGRLCQAISTLRSRSMKSGNSWPWFEAGEIRFGRRAGLGEELIDGVAHAEPRGHQQPRLRPAEDHGMARRSESRANRCGRWREPILAFSSSLPEWTAQIGDDAGVLKNVLLIKSCARLESVSSASPTPA